MNHVQTILALLLGWTTFASTPSSDVPRFSIDTSGTTAAVGVGAKGDFRLHIRPAEGYKVNDKGPLSLELSPTDKLTFDKSKLTRADVSGPDYSPAFSVGFHGAKLGEAKVKAKLTFVLCDDAITFCELKRAETDVVVLVEK